MARPGSILLVEDNLMDVELTLDAFAEKGLAGMVRVVSNGQEALDFLFGKGQYENRELFPLPDIILLDLKMPVIDGHEVLRQLKTTQVIKRIPVIVLTSSAEEGDLALSYDNGANGYLVKPVSFSSFKKVVEAIDEYWVKLNLPAPLPAG